jgi:DNA-binding NarL/FixJ family response regulator
LADSQSALRAADSLFGRLGAQADRHAVTSRLRATGLVSGPLLKGGFAALTAQQQQIARLASSGLTNKDIGARLRLSPRTVGSHLYHIYPALGVVGRRQLADALPLAP